MRYLFSIICCIAGPLAFSQNSGADSLGSGRARHPQKDTLSGNVVNETGSETKDKDKSSAAYTNLALELSQKKQYDQARIYFEKALAVASELNNKYRITLIYIGMGTMYTAKNEYEKANFYLQQALTTATIVHHKKELEEIYNQLTLLEIKARKFESALNYFALERKYRDSIYTEDKARTIAEVETQYEAEKKDQQIRLLERDKQIQSLWSSIIVAAGILITLLSVLVYLLQRSRQRKNHKILNLKIDALISQQNDLSEKYNDAVSGEEAPLASHDQRLLKKAIEIVENNISDRLFGVEKMADEMGMSRTNMHRKIKSITGFPPSELIRSIRLRKAALLIRNQTDSIAQIGFAVGFEDRSYFSKAFKKQFGVSPSDYLESVKTIGLISRPKNDSVIKEA